MFMAMRSKTMKPSELNEYAETLLARQLSTIEGVAQVSVFGGAKYAVRIQADPAALATAPDRHRHAAPRPSPPPTSIMATGALNGPTRSTVIHTSGQLNNARGFDNQIVAYRDWQPGPHLQGRGQGRRRQRKSLCQSWYKGEPAILIAVFRQPGSNTVGVIEQCPRTCCRSSRPICRHPAQLDIVFDRSQMIRASIADVQHDADHRRRRWWWA